MDYLKVSSKSSPASVAGAIAGLVKDGLPVEIQSVGAGAVNQAIKAIAIARGFLIPSGVDVLCAPTFQDIEIDGESRTAIRISVYPRFVNVAAAASSASQQPSAASVRDVQAATSVRTVASRYDDGYGDLPLAAQA